MTYNLVTAFLTFSGICVVPSDYFLWNTGFITSEKDSRTFHGSLLRIKSNFPLLSAKSIILSPLFSTTFHIIYCSPLYVITIFIWNNPVWSIFCTKLQHTMLHHILHFEFSQFLSTQTWFRFDLIYHVRVSNNNSIFLSKVYTFWWWKVYRYLKMCIIIHMFIKLDYSRK